MIQQVIVIVIFGCALFYLVRAIWRAFRSKEVCSTGCGKCGAIDVAAIEKQIREKGI